MAFEDIEQAVTSVPGLGPPDLSTPVFLHVRERAVVAVGVLAQMLGTGVVRWLAL